VTAVGSEASGELVEALGTNVLHLPVVGGGDGGIFTTAGDMHRLWAALDAGRVVAPAFHAVHLTGRLIWTVLSNTTTGARPVAVRLAEMLTGGGAPR
jgi:hypothetical protein